MIHLSERHRETLAYALNVSIWNVIWLPVGLAIFCALTCRIAVKSI